MDGIAPLTNTSAHSDPGVPIAPLPLVPGDRADASSSQAKPLDAAAPPPAFAAMQPGEVAVTGHSPPAPPPETVLVIRHRSADARDEAQVQEAVLRKEHAAEVARLTEALREAKLAHAGEIERLRL